MANKDERTFREAYDILRQHAETLREQDEPDIDNLTTIVAESIDAYKVCRARIDAVEKALEKAFSSEDAKAINRADPTVADGKQADEREAKGGKFDGFEDDIPF